MQPHDVANIFSNIEQIVDVHQVTLASLEKAGSNWPFVSGIGKIFLDIVSAFVSPSLYVLYRSSFSDSHVDTCRTIF